MICAQVDDISMIWFVPRWMTLVSYDLCPDGWQYFRMIFAEVDDISMKWFVLRWMTLVWDDLCSGWWHYWYMICAQVNDISFVWFVPRWMTFVWYNLCSGGWQRVKMMRREGRHRWRIFSSTSRISSVNRNGRQPSWRSTFLETSWYLSNHPVAYNIVQWVSSHSRC